MKRPILVLILVIGVAAAFYLSTKKPFDANRPKTDENMGNIILKSSSFKNNDFIPIRHTCDGENVNPLIEILNAPAETKSLILIMDDPDARLLAPERSDGGQAPAVPPGGGWDHWLLWNIDSKTNYIEEESLPAGAVMGKNSFGKENYGGPCPPIGSKPHHYNFKVYALDALLELAAGSSKQDLLKAMEGHVLDSGVLTGLYQRK